MILTIMLWLAMQGQATSIQDIQVSEAEPQHCIVGAQEVSCNTGIPGVTEGMKRPVEWQCPSIPTEHVFEIKAKREPSGTTRICSYMTFSVQPSCYTAPTPKYCPDGNYCKEIVDVTRELWMDGKRLGTIEGLD